MTEPIIIFKETTEPYATREWARKNIDLISDKTGLKLMPESIVSFRENLLVKNEILEQTFLIKCDERVCSEYDLGSIIVDCSLSCKVEGIIWLANRANDDIIEAFEWLNDATIKDFEMYLIDVKVEIT